jgi:hypothetical protein
MTDPVVWTMIRRGRRDLSRSGEGLGRVGEVMGERETDISNGLLVESGRHQETDYVPADRVAEI